MAIIATLFGYIPLLISPPLTFAFAQRTLDASRMFNAEKTRADTAASSESDLDMMHHVVIKNGNFGWEAGKFVLRDVNTRVSRSSLTIVVGPVGSGKSTLCKALLGEIPFSECSVALSTRFYMLDFVTGRHFSRNGSIRDNIVGFSLFNEERYAEVI